MNRLAPYAAVLMRLAVGGVFLRHGVGKVHNGLGATAEFLHGVGFPFPEFWALVLIGVETVGAVGVLLGVFTRVWAALMSVVMIVAILAVKIPRGGNFELETLLLAGALTLVALGDGPVSVGIRFKKGE